MLGKLSIAGGFLVASRLVRDLLLCAKQLFVAAIVAAIHRPCAESANQNMMAGPVAFGADAVLKGPAKQSARRGKRRGRLARKIAPSRIGTSAFCSTNISYRPVMA
jgi:hypothetical protein